MRGASRLRLVVLLGFGSLLVHELRYLVAYGDAAGAALTAHGHAYLAIVMPVVGLLLAAVSGHFLWAMAARRPEALGARRQTTAATFALALLAIYVGQEVLEGILASGHRGGLAGVFGDGGWLAIPLSGCVGCGLSLLVRGAHEVAGAVLGLGRFRSFVGLSALPVLLSSAPVLKANAPLARRGAERAPPVFVS